MKQIGFFMNIRCIALSAVLLFANPSCAAFGQTLCPCTGINIEILGIRSSTGTVVCALFESPNGFPAEVLRQATNVMVMKIRKMRAHCNFNDIPPGTYAIVVVHDENMNGILDTNWLGVPVEGYGFSIDAKGIVGAPSFSAASFPYNGGNLVMRMTLRY